MLENGLWVDRHATPGHHRQADALAEPHVTHRKRRRLCDCMMLERQGFDPGRMDVAAAADDHVLIASGNVKIARLVDPAEVAGHEPTLRVERLFGCPLVGE